LAKSLTWRTWITTERESQHLASLNQRARSELRANRLGEGFAAVDDEQHRSICAHAVLRLTWAGRIWPVGWIVDRLSPIPADRHQHRASPMCEPPPTALPMDGRAGQ
jgi:hypothetical protein